MSSKPHSVKSFIVDFWRRRFFSWLDRRNPRKNQHLLKLNNLYIFPTKRGFLFLFLVTVIWLLGTNYQNNLILSLTFLLLSIFIVSILHTYANLAGLEIQLSGAANAYAGEEVDFYFRIKNKTKQDSDSIFLQWQSSTIDSKSIAVEKSQDQTVHVSLSAPKRGVLTPKRLLVETEYPLGLLRCWTWLNFDAHAFVYPKPVEYPLWNDTAEGEDVDGDHPVKGGDDFNALSDYRPGDPLKHVAWKLYARDRGLYTKEFSQNVSREKWLDFSKVNAPDSEAKLSGLCYWALQLFQQDENYGLLLPGEKIAPDKGENHKARVLELLARFETP